MARGSRPRPGARPITLPSQPAFGPAQAGHGRVSRHACVHGDAGGGRMVNGGEGEKRGSRRQKKGSGAHPGHDSVVGDGEGRPESAGLEPGGRRSRLSKTRMHTLV